MKYSVNAGGQQLEVEAENPVDAFRVFITRRDRPGRPSLVFSVTSVHDNKRAWLPMWPVLQRLGLLSKGEWRKYLQVRPRLSMLAYLTKAEKELADLEGLPAPESHRNPSIAGRAVRWIRQRLKSIPIHTHPR